jgi:hypothetical protein
MAKVRDPKLPVFIPRTPPPTDPGCDAAAVALLCSQLPGIGWSIMAILRGMMWMLNVPLTTIQSYRVWSESFQQIILYPASESERKAFLRLTAIPTTRRALTVLAAYAHGQSARVIEYSEEIYSQQFADVQEIEASLTNAKEIVSDLQTRTSRLSSAPGMWGPYAIEVKCCLEEVQGSLSRIAPHKMRMRRERKELLAAISLLTLRAIVSFAGAQFSKQQIEPIKRSGFDRFARRLFQRVLGEVDTQDTQPVIAWLPDAQRASGVKNPRTVKALRSELDRHKIPTPLSLQVQEHVKRMWSK